MKGGIADEWRTGGVAYPRWQGNPSVGVLHVATAGELSTENRRHKTKWQKHNTATGLGASQRTQGTRVNLILGPIKGLEISKFFLL